MRQELVFYIKKGFSTLLFILIATSNSWAEDFHAKVIRVSDGDTVTVIANKPCEPGAKCKEGKPQYRVRLAQIDTPEKKQPWGADAKQALLTLVKGQTILVEEVTTDRWGRVVANLYLDGLWLNAELVRSGHAWVYRRYSNSDLLIAYEKEAKEAGRGLWSLSESDRIPPWEWRRK